MQALAPSLPLPPPQPALIPVCAACGRARGKSGRWYRIQPRFWCGRDADPTHGLCPRCVTRLYPWLAGRKRQ